MIAVGGVAHTAASRRRPGAPSRRRGGVPAPGSARRAQRRRRDDRGTGAIQRRRRARGGGLRGEPQEPVKPPRRVVPLGNRAQPPQLFRRVGLGDPLGVHREVGLADVASAQVRPELPHVPLDPGGVVVVVLVARPGRVQIHDQIAEARDAVSSSGSGMKPNARTARDVPGRTRSLRRRSRRPRGSPRSPSMSRPRTGALRPSRPRLRACRARRLRRSRILDRSRRSRPVQRARRPVFRLAVRRPERCHRQRDARLPSPVQRSPRDQRHLAPRPERRQSLRHHGSSSAAADASNATWRVQIRGSLQREVEARHDRRETRPAAAQRPEQVGSRS